VTVLRVTVHSHFGDEPLNDTWVDDEHTAVILGVNGPVRTHLTDVKLCIRESGHA